RGSHRASGGGPDDRPALLVVERRTSGQPPHPERRGHRGENHLTLHHHHVALLILGPVRGGPTAPPATFGHHRCRASASGVRTPGRETAIPCRRPSCRLPEQGTTRRPPSPG